MLPSRPFRCSQRHQTHLHFFAGVITKDKRVLKGSKFTHWSPCIWKRKLSITPNSAPWFQPGVKFTQGEKSQHIIFHCTVFSSSLLTAKALSMFKAEYRSENSLIAFSSWSHSQYIQVTARYGTGTPHLRYRQIIWKIHFLFTYCVVRGHILKSLQDIMLEMPPSPKWICSGQLSWTQERWLYLNTDLFPGEISWMANKTSHGSYASSESMMSVKFDRKKAQIVVGWRVEL